MKNFKRALALVLSALMVVALLAGCGGKTDTDEPETIENEKVEIQLGIYPESDEATIALHDGYIETLTAQYAENGIDLTVTPAPYTYAADTFIAMANAGTTPTFFETWFTEPQKLIANDYVADITSELKAKGWDNKIASSVKSLLQDENGNIYGVPRDAYALGIFINVDVFKEAGLVDEDGVPLFPKTWEELAEYAKTIEEKTDADGFCLLGSGKTGGWQFSNIAWCFGTKDLVTVNSDGSYTSHLDDAGVVEAMEYIQSLVWDYKGTTDDPTSEDWVSGHLKIGTGAVGMYIGANDAVNQPCLYQAALPAESLAIGAIPAGPHGDQYSLSGGTPYMFSSNATSEEITAGLDYLEVMGKGPVVSSGVEDDFKWRVENNVPVIKTFPVWDDADYNKDMDALVEKYSNVNEANFAEYFEAISKSGNLHTEEPGDTQEMYQYLGDVLEEVVTNKNADIPALLATAQTEYQAHLDDM